jgi:hypothetical protein
MTLRNAPLWDRTVSDILLIWGKREVEYFCKWGWTGFTDLPVVGQSKVVARIEPFAKPIGSFMMGIASAFAL